MAERETIAILRRLGIADGDVTLTPLSGGVSCDVWRADIPGEAPLVVKQALPKLRVAADWRAPVARAENEVAWLRRVAAIDPTLVPAVVATSPADHLFVLGWCEGPVWRDELVAGRVDPAFAGRLGTDLARIHAATAGEPGCYDPALFDALRIAPFLRYAAERVPVAADVLAALADDLANRRIALVHGDVSPKNIIVAGDHGLFLDAEPAVYGDPAFDLAFCTTHLLLKTIWLAEHEAALHAAAAIFVDRYLAGVSWEAPEPLAIRAGALVAALLLARVEGKSPAPYLDDRTGAIVRARALALLARPPAPLPTIIAQWEPA